MTDCSTLPANGVANNDVRKRLFHCPAKALSTDVCVVVVVMTLSRRMCNI